MQLAVRVIPRSARNALEWAEGGLKVHLTTPPVDGAANTALITLLAERLSLPKRAIRIVRGTTSRHKLVEIEGLTLEELQQRLGSAR